MAKKDKLTPSVKQDSKQDRPTAFKPGQSGNPAGRPPGRTIQKEVREAAVEKIEWWFEVIFMLPEDKLTEILTTSKDLSRADKVMLAESTDREVLGSILDRIVGKPAQVKIDNDAGSENVESFLRRLMNGGANGQT